MNQKRYWLQGGLLALLIPLFYLTFIPLVSYFCLPTNRNGIAFSGCGHEQKNIFISNIKVIFEENYGFNLFTRYILMFFLGGALLGWLYGKIKYRKNKI